MNNDEKIKSRTKLKQSWEGGASAEEVLDMLLLLRMTIATLL
jgi:hypothetical protein